ncbi:hypothetical protein, partial [Bradyrhizobium diazoefficiens]|uniref:hypothetical protein n=1 Tax=Bradyrhizobium diazoefficiens TaxID=1355477 RepID=UPI001B8D0018
MKDGPYRYCTGHCCDRGRILLGHLKNVSEAEINSIIEQAHYGPCDSCGGSYAGFWVTRRSGGVVFRHLDDLDAVFESDTCA